MNIEELHEWAEKLLETHKNPLKKLDSHGTKLLLPSDSQEEKDLISNHLDYVVKVLRNERVERRCARAIGKWLPDKKLLEIIKVTGIVNNFGFANKDGKFLYPEETMFLLETNRLELLWNDVPISIQQAYQTVLNDVPRYLMYRKLTLQGFRLAPAKNNDIGEPSRKKCRYMTSEVSEDSPNMVKCILKKCQEVGPKKCNLETNLDCDYRMFSPESLKGFPADFNVVLWQNKVIDESIGMLDDKTIVEYIRPEFSGCFSFRRVNLPDLM